MLQSEFESKIGKKVDIETFEIYNKMYMSIDADKDTFITMLNINAIPESKSVIEAREKIRKAVDDKQKEIDQIRIYIEECEYDIKFDYHTRYNTKRLKEYKSQIRELKNQIKLLLNID